MKDPADQCVQQQINALSDALVACTLFKDSADADGKKKAAQHIRDANNAVRLFAKKTDDVLHPMTMTPDEWRAQQKFKRISEQIETTRLSCEEMSALLSVILENMQEKKSVHMLIPEFDALVSTLRKELLNVENVVVEVDTL